MDAIIVTDGTAEEIAALVLVVQERQTSEITKKVIKHITEGFDYLLSSSRTPE